MSNTRRAEPGNGFRQERYASSPGLERGFNAVLVKLRCGTLRNEKDIELAWFLQYLSTLPGGIEKAARDIYAAFPERQGTPEMREIGARPRGNYNAAEVRKVRVPKSPFSVDTFPLRGERQHALDVWTDIEPSRLDEDPGLAQAVRAVKLRKAERDKKSAAASKTFPTSYPVASFLNVCREMYLEIVPERLTEFCLNPAFDPEQLCAATKGEWVGFDAPVFHDLYGALHEYMALWEKKRLAGIVVTEIGKKVLDALDYAEAERALVLIEGEYGTGKTFITKAWCEARPGKRRYIQAPSSNDSLDFFRTVAEPIGVSHALSLKSQQMRARINEVLQAGYLTVVFDEAHYLFPQASARVALPAKINWVLTALTNYEVPVALVSTPQFTAAQATVEKNTHWASGQFIGRISRYVKLPEALEESELGHIARFHLPAGDAKSIRALVLYAQASRKRLRGIEHGIKAARHVARRAGRDQATLADIKQALRESVMPSDSALNQALDAASAPPATALKKHRSKVYAVPMQEPLTTISSPLSDRNKGEALATVPSDRAMRSPAGLSSV